MSTAIEFIPGKKEITLPIVKLTKSKDRSTGTATFLFINPTIFLSSFYENHDLNGMVLIWEQKKIITKDITIIFQEGKPFLLKAFFVFKNSSDWFEFLNFMNSYSKETGLFFAETNSSMKN